MCSHEVLQDSEFLIDQLIASVLKFSFLEYSWSFILDPRSNYTYAIYLSDPKYI